MSINATRIIIAGSRTIESNQENFEKLCEAMSFIMPRYPITILSGGCRGVDRLGEEYARTYGLECDVFLPDWDQYGKAAGPIRNRAMAKSCDGAFILWDGRSQGTRGLMQILSAEEKWFFCLTI